MANLTISFTAATPTPANGYRVKYWNIDNLANITTVSPNPTSSPVIISVPAGNYAGTIESACGGGQFSSIQNFTANYPFYYYAVSKFDCGNSCLQVGTTGFFVARSSVALSTSNGYYYKSGTFTYQVVNAITPAPATFDVDLDGTTSGANCNIVCGGAQTGSSITITNSSNTSISITDFNPAWFTINQGNLQPLTSGNSASGTHSGYVGNWGITVSGVSSGCLILYKNEGVFLDSIALSGAGIYTFLNVNLLSTDEVTLMYANNCP